MIVEKYTKDNEVLDVIFDEDAFIHITSIASKFKKRPETWLKTQGTKDYISALKSVLPDIELVIVNNGGLTPGTWIHPKLAIVFARWLSPEFAVWCDTKIETLLKKGYVGATSDIQNELDALSPKVNTVKKYIRKTNGGVKMNQIVEVLSTMEQSARTLNDYRCTLANITSAADTKSREKVYNKLIKGTYKAYNDGLIDRRTEEDVLQILNANLIKLLRRRFNEVSKNLNKEVKNSEIDTYLEEIESLKSKINDLETELEDPRPYKFNLKTTNSQDFADAVNNINSNPAYIVAFYGVMEENTNKVNKKHPDWRGDSSCNKTSAGIWVNDDYYFLNLSVSSPPYSPLSKIDLYQSPSDEEVFVGSDNVKRYFATFNHITGALIIYRKK